MIGATVRIKDVLPRLRGDRLLSQGAVAFAIKIGAAGLSFLMFVALSRALGPEQFGIFGIAFSAATLLALIGSFGQRNLVLRFASVYIGQADKPRAFGVIRFGYIRVLTGNWLITVVLALMALILTEYRTILAATALLTITLALAEFQPHPQRAAGRIVLALLPRDILLRVAMIVLCLLIIFEQFPTLSAAQICSLMAGVLAILTLGQAFAEPYTNPARLIMEPAKSDDIQNWRRASWGFWGNSVVNAAGRNLAIVLLGLILTAEQSGAVFAALRTAMLLELALMAVNIVAAPKLAQSLAARNTDEAEALCRNVTVMVAVPTTLAFVIFLTAGPHILSLFRPDFSTAYPALILISLGYFFSALSGPTTQLMEMGGYERTYFRILAITTVVSLIALLPLAATFGMAGGAIAIAANLIAHNAWCIMFLRRELGVTPGLIPLGRVRPT